MSQAWYRLTGYCKGERLSNDAWHARYWARVNRAGPDDCWLWMAGRQSAGYGAFSIGGKQFGAHRLAWMLSNGPIPPGALIMHSCDNPPCCNPRHLSLGDIVSNRADCIAKGRHARGERQAKSKLTQDQILEIRRRLSTGEYQRLIAADFGVSQVTISHIALGRQWRHVPTDTPVEEVQ